MITDALDAGVRCSWVAGDEVYGASPELRTRCTNARSATLVVATSRRVPPPPAR